MDLGDVGAFFQGSSHEDGAVAIKSSEVLGFVKIIPNHSYILQEYGLALDGVNNCLSDLLSRKVIPTCLYIEGLAAGFYLTSRNIVQLATDASQNRRQGNVHFCQFVQLQLDFDNLLR